MTITDLAAQRSKILHLLEQAGPSGLPKSRLGVRNDFAGLRNKEALRQLEAEQRIANMGYGNRSRYVLALHFNPLERAYDLLLQRALAANKGVLTLFTAEQLKTPSLPAGPINKEADAAFRLLVQEGVIIAARRKNYLLYFLRQALPGMTTVSPATIQWERVVNAYQQLVRETQFSHVFISELHRVLGKPPLEALKQHLLEACRTGQAIPSEGDKSLASPEERGAGLEIGGRLYLQIHLVS